MSPYGRYSIRSLNDSDADRHVQMAFLREVCPEDYLLQETSRLKWQYINNPAGLEFPSVWVFLEGERIVGQLGVIPVTLNVKGKLYKGAWCADFIVHPEFRNRGVGPLLLREVAREFDLLMVLGTNELSYPLYKKAGWVDLGNVPHHVKILNLQSVLLRWLPKRLAKCLSLPSDLMVSGFAWFWRPDKSDISLSSSYSFGSEFDHLWDRIAFKLGCAVRRDHHYLNWKYFMQPRMQYVVFRADRGGQLEGYVVVRKIENLFSSHGVIADLIANPADQAIIDALLWVALSYLTQVGVGIVRCCTSQRYYRSALKRHGFIARDSHIRFMFSLRTGLVTSDIAYSLENWFLINGDSDLDRIP